MISSTKTDDRQVLEGEAASKAECIIVQRGKKYFWQSRNNVPMIRIDKPPFHVLRAERGTRLCQGLDRRTAETNAPAEYIEILTNGFEVVTYWGRVPCPVRNLCSVTLLTDIIRVIPSDRMSETSTQQVTRLLVDWSNGDQKR